MQTLQDQNRLISPVFCFLLSNTGWQLFIGGSPTIIFPKMIWMDVYSKGGYWEVILDSIIVNGVEIVVSLSAILDSGTPTITGDPKTIATLFGHFSDHVQPNGRSVVYISCPAEDPDHPDPDLCVAGAIANPKIKEGGDPWILGLPLMKERITGWYFDRSEPQFQVGFADLV